MHETRRNLFYELKKQSTQRSNPFHNPDPTEDDLRHQLQTLRAKIRAQDTEIIRLQSKVHDLTQKLELSATRSKTFQSNKEEQMKEAVNSLSSTPMILENRELREANQRLEENCLEMNGKNNLLEAELRQIRSDKYQLELKVKQCGVLEKMREQRFKDEVQRLTPIIVEQPSDFAMLKFCTIQVTSHLRKKITETLEHIFLLSARDCESNKKKNSFTIFMGYFNQLAEKKNYGVAAVMSAYRAMLKVMRILDETYGELKEEVECGGSIDEWVRDSVREIRAMGGLKSGEEARKLFRLLGVKYRCRFPIKGEVHEISGEVMSYLEHIINIEAEKLILPKKQSNQGEQGNDN